MTLPGKNPRDSRVTLTQLMGPQDANILGNVHGGIIMKLCDEAGAMAATKYARHPTVTVTVDSMSFHSPVHLSNLLTVCAEISWVGRTSMEARIVVTAEDIYTGVETHTNTAYILYVALDEHGKPCPVPPLICETAVEEERYQRATDRQAYRLKQRLQGTI